MVPLTVELLDTSQAGMAEVENLEDALTYAWCGSIRHDWKEIRQSIV